MKKINNEQRKMFIKNLTKIFADRRGIENENQRQEERRVRAEYFAKHLKRTNEVEKLWNEFVRGAEKLFVDTGIIFDVACNTGWTDKFEVVKKVELTKSKRESLDKTLEKSKNKLTEADAINFIVASEFVEEVEEMIRKL